MPSRTMAGVFGIARITGTPSGRRLSYQSVESAAATESSVCSGPSAGPISASSAAASCGLTATITSDAPAAAAALSASTGDP